MKPLRIACFAGLVALFPLSRADSILLSDNFSGSSLNTSNWNTILPFGQSSVVQSGGELTTTGRGILATNQGFDQPYVLNTAFTLNDSLEHFDIALRTDLGVFLPQYQERAGLIVSFVTDGQGVSLQEFHENPVNENDWKQDDTTPYNLVVGQTYFATIVDTGTHVTVSLDGSVILSDDTSFSTGDQIAFYSREFPSTSTSIDAVTISSPPGVSNVPDGGMTAVLFGVALAALGLVRRIAGLRIATAI